jgi:hypothetical protein
MPALEAGIEMFHAADPGVNILYFRIFCEEHTLIL